MKKSHVILLLLALALLLCACEEQDPTYQVEKNGITFTVDPETLTISDGKNTYHYFYVGMGNENHMTYDISIYYPDGSTFQWRTEVVDGVSSGGGEGSDGYDPDRYVSGEILVDIVENIDYSDNSVDWPYIVAGIIIIIVGVLNIVFPCFWWQLKYGLYVRDAEPTEFAITMSRIGGGICIAVGLICIVTALI